MINIAVCDDEKTMLKQISGYLDQFRTETGKSFNVYYYSSAEDVMEHMNRSTQILLLDISMAQMTGMECAQTLRKEGFNGEIIFITSMEDYAIKGYGVHAFAFLAKPVTYTEFKTTLEDCFSKLSKNKASVIAVETDHGIEIIKAEDILFAEVYQHHTSFSLKDGTSKDSAIQLSEVEDKLKAHGFFRCHRSYLVNMRQISRITASELVLSNGARVPLSRHRNRDFLTAYTSFMGEILK